MKMIITLTMNEETARLLMDSAEFYARVMWGQYDVIPDKTAEIRLSNIRMYEGEEAVRKADVEEYRRCRSAQDTLNEARWCQQESDTWGIHYTRKTDICFNTYQAIRYALGRKRAENGLEGDLREPTKLETLIPEVEITDAVKMIIDEEAARAIMDATEFYARILCSQYDFFARHVAECRLAHFKETEGENAWKEHSSKEYANMRPGENRLEAARRIMFPELDWNETWGLGYTRETDIAFNIYQAIRYGISWHNEPAGGLGVNFYEPSAHQYPYPEVEIDGKVYLKGQFEDEASS